jgi:hypothetical protein
MRAADIPISKIYGRLPQTLRFEYASNEGKTNPAGRQEKDVHFRTLLADTCRPVLIV